MQRRREVEPIDHFHEVWESVYLLRTYVLDLLPRFGDMARSEAGLLDVAVVDAIILRSRSLLEFFFGRRAKDGSRRYDDRDWYAQNFAPGWRVEDYEVDIADRALLQLDRGVVHLTKMRAPLRIDPEDPQFDIEGIGRFVLHMADRWRSTVDGHSIAEDWSTYGAYGGGATHGPNG